ncbi:MAG: Uracil phosphoribosyltransferase [Proteiniphilum acetatigenes]|uniref:Uracil phosphoribosyltransferase n=1 Tax=Proteiniphilum acetatigenes TaxID=294710 RepID=A0A101HGY5_9BACT|nr:MAG: Uracil phosphoribosyltransferase [Proteiniphilum acetatigenes]KUL19798.1 MAG: Uracil phosphoribosyltransferase [Proteiniphilum sp. 51_7]
MGELFKLETKMITFVFRKMIDHCSISSMKVTNFSENNSILNTFVREIRDVTIQKDRFRFRRNIERLGEIMAYEISKDLRYKTIQVTTPLDVAEVSVPDEEIVIATILRAGLPYHQGVLNYFDGAENAFVSAYRKYKETGHKTFDIHIEYIASPSIEGKTLILTDPMLATGGSMELTYRALLTKGTPAHIHIATVIASQQAIDYCIKNFPEEKTTIWAAAIDPELNEASYIVPGIGDAGDLAYGQKD